MALDALNILDHQAKRFGVVTVIDATLFDLVTGEPILELDTLKMANISTEAEEKEIRGGQQASQLIIYDYARTASMEMQDALGSIASMQYMWGSQLSDEGVTKHIKVPGEVEVDGGVATVDVTGNIPVGTSVTVRFVDSLDPTVTEKEVFLVTTANRAFAAGVTTLTIPDTVPAPDPLDPPVNRFADEDVVTVYAEVLAGAGAQQLTLSTKSFSNNVKIVGKTFVIDQRTGVRKAAELEIHNFQLNPTFELMFDSEGEASVFDFSGRALQDGEGKFITLKYLNENF
jgi:hypothetical protein